MTDATQAGGERATAGQTLQLAIEGEMTIARAAELSATIMPAIGAAPEVEINLARVTGIDGAGLQLMMSAKIEAWARNRTLRFVGHSKPVLDMLDLCDLGTFFGDQVVISSQAG